MYQEKKRERRRRDKQRMKEKAVRVARNSWSYDHESRAVKHADYLAVCSCCMCGNPRRHFGARTLQEIKSDSGKGRLRMTFDPPIDDLD